MKTSKLKPKRDGRVRSSKIVMPRTESEWCAYRCQLSCKIGRDTLEGKTQPPAGCSPMEYAMFNLLYAIEELSRHNTERSDRAKD